MKNSDMLVILNANVWIANLISMPLDSPRYVEMVFYTAIACVVVFLVFLGKVIKTVIK